MSTQNTQTVTMTATRGARTHLIVAVARGARA
ncbi:hypothetical protein HNR17_000195 [Galbitalea soli]|nr:hypothetical protein [Galbitalea soli]